MAKKSVIMRNELREKLSRNAKEARTALKKIISSVVSDPESKEEAGIKLQKRKRNESPIRIRKRCLLCGRPNGTLKKFMLCRIHLREAAMRGDVPGLKKASW